MNQLNKLIEQYETENPGKKAKEKIYLVNGEWVCNRYTNEFVLWLATRPTCGVEQRKFLDEVEKFEHSQSNIGTNDKLISSHDKGVLIWQSKFTADLNKVIKGE